jgi:hypothetical protein
MISGKLLTTVAAGVVLGVAAMGPAPSAWAASDTSGLKPLTLEGIGRGSLADANTCGQVSCATAGICQCLAANYTLVGNQGFAKGALGINLIVDTTTPALPISDVDSCFPAGGTGRLASSNGKIIVNMTVSGLECPTVGGPNVFSGTYVVTGASGGKYSSSSGGTGAINGSQETTGGAVGQVAIIGTIQPNAPVSASSSSDSESDSDSEQAP